ncbi:MAG: DUF3179 domain-containing protein [Gemmatimonadetes bacterium]|nr:DUF3179 domain-containing protein [Gemmatimonadota bacterium]NNM06392.1 DUF3179 domain-containing protein [Gemmatimonadota bacterium]
MDLNHTEFRRTVLVLAIGALVTAGCQKMPINEGTVFLPADSAGWLEPGDLVIGFAGEGQSRAYPIRALSPIEVLNDTIDGIPVVVTWCPLSATGAIFSSRTQGEAKRFRFHPDLYHMNLLFEDAETGSVWSQLSLRAVDGEEEGKELILVPTVQTTWSEWLRTHPETTVLRSDWGRGRFSYRLPADGSPPGARAERELALVVIRGQERRVYPISDLSRAAGPVEDTIAGEPLTVHFNPEGPTAFATDLAGTLLPSVIMYWKYLEDFFPDSEIWEP